MSSPGLSLNLFTSTIYENQNTIMHVSEIICRLKRFFPKKNTRSNARFVFVLFELANRSANLCLLRFCWSPLVMCSLHQQIVLHQQNFAMHQQKICRTSKLWFLPNSSFFTQICCLGDSFLLRQKAYASPANFNVEIGWN
jgi:hypothetical protein